jgi:3-hydroxybutyryl-CoA dehydrogenase
MDTVLGVVGAGTMGNGIAHVCAAAGCRVLLYDMSEAALARGLERIESNLRREVAKGLRTGEQAEAARARVVPAARLEDLAGVKVAIEAAPERFGVKADLFRALDQILAPESILASNTSSISITKLAAQTKRPGHVIGLHFFNPVPVMRLVEVIRGLVQGLGKTPVEVNDAAGFVSNRVLMPLINEAVYAVMEGVATVEAVDQVFVLGMAHPMGPLTLADFIGLDVCLDILRVLVDGLGDPKYRPCPLLVRMVDAGWLGRKSGRGFYRYDEDGRRSG